MFGKTMYMYLVGGIEYCVINGYRTSGANVIIYINRYFYFIDSSDPVNKQDIFKAALDKQVIRLKIGQIYRCAAYIRAYI